MPETESLIAYLATHDAPCPGCGYNLRGLVSDRCPECARTIYLRELEAGSARAWRLEAVTLITVGNLLPIMISVAFVAMLLVTSIGFDFYMASGWLMVLLGHLVLVWVFLKPVHRRIDRSLKWVIIFNPITVSALMYLLMAVLFPSVGHPTV